jgi:hypothetical protein
MICVLGDAGFLTDAVLFVLVGLSARSFTSKAIGPVGGLFLTGTAVVATVILVRLGAVSIAAALPGPGRTTPSETQALTETTEGRRV